MHGTLEHESAKRNGFNVTGRLVFLCLLGFFVTVAAVNGVMIYAATTTFGGVETENAYKAGLAFNRDIAAAQRQDDLHWNVSGHITHDQNGARLEIDVADRSGAALPGVEVTAQLAHPTDARRDEVVPLRTTQAGHFVGDVTAAAGLWNLVIDISRGEERLFRSRARIVLR